MRYLTLFILAVLMIVLLAPSVSAGYIEAQRSATMKYYVLVSLGIENLPNMTLTKASSLYNWIAIGFIFLIGSMSSKRMTRFFAILIPIFASLFVYFGWLQASNPAQTYAVIIICAIMGVVTYMKGSLRENFGGGGPGNLIINIVFYLIILQTCVGLVNATGVWQHGNQTNYAPTPTDYQMNAPNADLTQTVPTISNSGGLLQSVTGTASILAQLAISCVKMLMDIVVSIAAFSITINNIFPFITAPDGGGMLGVFMLAALQVGIWFAYVLFFVNLMAKPFPDSTAF
jgi:hypothetical protein